MTARRDSVFDHDHTDPTASFKVTLEGTAPQVLIVCEHASPYMPAHLGQLGLNADAAKSHIAWDPGALSVAEHLHRMMPSILVQGTLSRLIYDCNRPPEAPSAIPERSEIYEIPGNQNLSEDDRQSRIAQVYTPFRQALGTAIAQHRRSLKLMVTIHSFTPIFHNKKRAVELGILHGKDARFATAMMHAAPESGPYCLRLNEPYAASDGVAHTLDLHGAENGLQNVMIEIRNDLIATPSDQGAMAEYLAPWLEHSLDRVSQEDTAA